MRDYLFQRKLLQSLVQAELITPHHEYVDIVMIARDAPEIQINRPAAGEKERRAQITYRLRNLK